MSSSYSQHVRHYRAEYRRDHVGPHYSGVLHLCFTFGVGTLTLIICIGQLEHVQPMEWITLPLTFLYANLSEYVGHRGPMHHRVNGLGLLFRRHAGQHHRFFTNQAMSFDHRQDFKAVLFPPILMVFFLGAFALPAGLLLSWLFSPNVAWLFVAMAIGYFLNYEILHFAYHCEPDSRIGRFPGVNRLRQLHLDHHDPSLMQHKNFNITYPLCDWVFGSLHRSADRSPPAKS